MENLGSGLARLVPGAVVAALLLAVGCSPPPHREREFNAGWVVSANVLQRWNEEKARLGSTFGGSPAWRSHVQFVERELRDRGVRLLPRLPAPYDRWHTSDDPASDRWSLTIDGKPVPVAGYWAYSGSTAADGVTAPLLLYDADRAGELAGRIVVFSVPSLPESPPAIFVPPPAEFVTADVGATGIASQQWYQVNYPTRFGRWDSVLRGSGAAGAIVVYDLSPERARGLYTFPLLDARPVGVPGLHVDRDAGAMVKAAAAQGSKATLRLLAETARAEPWFLTGILPGRDFGTPKDELVMLVTHTDGPNLSQENGALTVLAIVDYFAKLTQLERRRSILVVLDPQHYSPGRHLVDWYAENPQIMERVVASIGVEHFGQREFGGANGALQLTGRPEKTLIFAQDNARLVEAAVEAIRAEAVPRTELRVPARRQGPWVGLGEIGPKLGLPAYGTSTDMSAYWSTAPGIESFDADLARRQLGVLVRLTETLLTENLATLAVSTRATVPAEPGRSEAR